MGWALAGLLAVLLAGAVLGWAREARRRRRDAAAAAERPPALAEGHGRLLDAVGHELRTPLSTILGHQELLAEGIYGPLEGRTRKPVVRIGDAATQLLHLVDGVLDAARVELGAPFVNLDVTNTEELVFAAERYARSLAVERGGSLESDIQDPLPAIRTDPARAERVLFLAVTAAVRGTPAGGMRLRVRWDDAAPALLFVLEGLDLPLTPDPLPTAGGTGAWPTGEGDAPVEGAVPRARGELEQALAAGAAGAAGPGRSWLRLSAARVGAAVLSGSVRVEPGPGEETRLVVRLPHLEGPPAD